MKVEGRTAGTIKRRPDGLTVAVTYRRPPTEELLHEVVDELPSEPNLYR